MKTLVTGAGGFIGKHLCTSLIDQGHTVTALDRRIDRSAMPDDPGIRLCEADCTKGSDLEGVLDGVDTVFHLAGIKRTEKPLLYHIVNTGGTAKLLAACEKKGGVRRFLFLSSVGAAGPSRAYHRLREIDEPRPANEYGKSKLQAERILAGGTVPWTVIRAPIVYGPGIKDAIYRIIELTSKHIQPVVGSGWLNFIYVEDLVRGLIAAAESAKTENSLYFLAHPRIHRWIEMYDTARDVVGTWTVRIKLPFMVLYPLARFNDAVNLLSRANMVFGRRNLEDIRYSYWMIDVSRARREFGFEAQIDLREGIKRVFQWQKKMEEARS